jgi:hypothetical protein
LKLESKALALGVWAEILELESKALALGVWAEKLELESKALALGVWAEKLKLESKALALGVWAEKLELESKALALGECGKKCAQIQTLIRPISGNFSDEIIRESFVGWIERSANPPQRSSGTLNFVLERPSQGTRKSHILIFFVPTETVHHL